jgi:hypothetical protein
LNSIPQGSAQGKPLDPAAQREILTNNLRAAIAKARLAATTLETISIQLRHRQVSSEQAMAWVEHEGLAHFLRFAPKGGA